ncbi:hypothetical protein FLAPJACK_14 [Bacillus phage Flapjack]|uniref:Uncharacterized protein n=1 Tax=Bacillus phage Flapjack TaxID=1983465 RepID=A0A1X9SFU8_9CAUD|nr:hypothetical protein FLAPJACK_14 [Bacillus phage Flapjack]
MEMDEIQHAAALLELKKKYQSFLAGELDKYRMAQSVYVYCNTWGKEYEKVINNL